ncbi:hypothetical protein LSAT2_026535, partial [Lamellibrachia satsuma]
VGSSHCVCSFESSTSPMGVVRGASSGCADQLRRELRNMCEMLRAVLPQVASSQSADPAAYVARKATHRFRNGGSGSCFHTTPSSG